MGIKDDGRSSWLWRLSWCNTLWARIQQDARRASWAWRVHALLDTLRPSPHFCHLQWFDFPPQGSLLSKNSERPWRDCLLVLSSAKEVLWRNHALMSLRSLTCHFFMRVRDTLYKWIPGASRLCCGDWQLPGSEEELRSNVMKYLPKHISGNIEKLQNLLMPSLVGSAPHIRPMWWEYIIHMLKLQAF